jgi:hypothetical protein
MYLAGTVVQAIADEFGVGPHCVRSTVRRAGYALKKRGQQPRLFSKAEVKDIERRWKSGESQYSIARAYGSSQVVISRVLRANGCKPSVRKAVGARHGMWKGGRTLTEGGYVAVFLSPEDPFSAMRNRSGYVLEHRLVMARHLGRTLLSNETVHHKDGDRKNNKLRNLQLRVGRHGKGVHLQCLDCGSKRMGPCQI